jgi:hypothetical protein
MMSPYEFEPEPEPESIITTESGIQIKVLEKRYHNKASESYVDVEISYPEGNKFNWSIPIEYRRTGTDLTEATEEELNQYIVEVAEACSPSKWEAWRKEQDAFWQGKSKAATTKEFFDVLASEFAWCSTETDLPKNPNWARRIQDLKEFGYTLATNTNKRNCKTGKNCTHLVLLPLPKGGISGYESWTPELKDKIIKLLGSYDVFEAKIIRKESLIPDHKFPEIRWDKDTRRVSLEDLTDEEIRRDFQLLNNQRNLQKREVCRTCFQTNKRGYPYGIKYFYEGDENWGDGIPKRGKDAEQDCIGCGWYDLEIWRKSITEKSTDSE